MKEYPEDFLKRVREEYQGDIGLSEMLVYALERGADQGMRELLFVGQMAVRNIDAAGIIVDLDAGNVVAVRDVMERYLRRQKLCQEFLAMSLSR